MTHFQSRDAHARGGLTMLVAFCACVAATTPVMAHPFTIADDRGMLTASWKGEAGKIADNAPTDADVAALAEVKDLEKIVIGGCTAIRGTGFAALENLPKLRVISFNGCGPRQFSELFDADLEGYAALAKLRQVREVSCGHVRLPVEGAVMLLTRMPALETFNPGTYADDAILAAAAKAPNLKSLGFGHWPTVPKAQATMAGVAHYAEMKKLTNLSAGQLRPADGSVADWVAAIMAAPALSSARVQFNAKTDTEVPPGHPQELCSASAAEFAAVAASQSLERLIVNGASVQMGGLAPLGKMPSLKFIALEQGEVPAEEETALKAANAALQVIVRPIPRPK